MIRETWTVHHSVLSCQRTLLSKWAQKSSKMRDSHTKTDLYVARRNILVVTLSLFIGCVGGGSANLRNFFWTSTLKKSRLPKTSFSNNHDAEHTHFRRQFLPCPHKSNMLESGHDPSWSRVVAVCQCQDHRALEEVHAANQIIGRDQRQDLD